jgi:DNA-binding response OmpR family regulator
VRHILVVDDSEDLLSQYEFSFRSVKYNVTTAVSGDDALMKLESRLLINEAIDVILVDLQMSGMNGADLIANLRERGIEIPIVAISRSGSKEMVIELMRRGCSDYIEKPVSFGGLYTRIEEAVKRNALYSKQRSDDTYKENITSQNGGN